MHDIYKSLQADHRLIAKLVSDLDRAADHAGVDREGRQRLLDHLVVASAAHEACEELVFWPAVRSRAVDGRALSGKGLLQERDAKFVLDAMRFGSDDPSLLDQVRELARLTSSHMAFEEQEAWPALRRRITWLGARLLGLKYSFAKRWTPTRPHPRGPDRPLGLATKGAVVVVVDHMRDRLTGRRRGYPDLTEMAKAPDPAAVLAHDHAEIDSLLGALEGEVCPDPSVVNELIKSVSIHDAIEREHLYPILRRRLNDGNLAYPQWITQHGEFARALAEIDRHPDEPAYRREQLQGLIPALPRPHPPRGARPATGGQRTHDRRGAGRTRPCPLRSQVQGPYPAARPHRWRRCRRQAVPPGFRPRRQGARPPSRPTLNRPAPVGIDGKTSEAGCEPWARQRS